MEPLAEPGQRQKCEVFSRVVGYVTRIDSWNSGKTEEFKDRKLFKVDENEKQ